MRDSHSMFYKKLFTYIVIVIVLTTLGLLVYPYIKKLIDNYICFIYSVEIAIFSILFIFVLGYLLCRGNKKNYKEDLDSELFDDDIYEELNKNKIDGVKNIIESYKSNRFFSLALIGVWGSGKSSFLHALKTNIKKDKVIELNVWKLENIQNLLQEIEKEFDDIIFKLNKTGWVFYHLKSIFIKNYFSVLSKYFLEDKINISLSFSQTIQESKISYNNLLKESLQDEKIVLMLDEVDRLDSEEDILNVFKVIRYLTSFDKVFTITALDIEKVGEKVGLEYTHKIFSSKYAIPNTTKSELHQFLKDDISKRLSDFVDNQDFEKLLKTKANDKILIDYIQTYRQIKNCYNDTYILCKSLEYNDPEWKKYISFEFIFVLNLIKALDFEFYMQIMQNKNLTNFVLGELFYKKITRATNSNDKQEKDEQLYKDNIDKYLAFGDIINLYTILLRDKNLEQSTYIYEHYRTYEYMISEVEYKEFLETPNKIKDKFQKLSYEKEEQKLFVVFLVSKIYANKNIKDLKEILKSIKELMSNDEYLKIIYLLLESFDNRGISKEVIKKMFEIYFETLELKQDESTRLIDEINNSISKISNRDLQFELYKIAYNYFKDKSLESNFKISLCNVQDLLELDSSNFSRFIKLIEYLGEETNSFFEDDKIYMLWTKDSHSSNLMTKHEYNGKEIKKLINITLGVNN
ncbi:MAG: P-loop NTPase fold protein [Aliarcobacter skirrowii]|uniref:P-loop NTPase fold protein n=1 Tax=Aliarcobacter skirrowii TaxID=28200 RepID=UPI00242A7EDA|nr:P-loop NTPase fold protein [Aliarcobacter skirrowii]MDD2509387.1 P-loop NTPase fold protein [Aliarcobacter skirrowii]MDD3496979.1 P-loop NTPase fold protein [Aliarcobacter skirrowii]